MACCNRRRLSSAIVGSPRWLATCRWLLRPSGEAAPLPSALVLRSLTVHIPLGSAVRRGFGAWHRWDRSGGRCARCRTGHSEGTRLRRFACSYRLPGLRRSSDAAVGGRSRSDQDAHRGSGAALDRERDWRVMSGVGCSGWVVTRLLVHESMFGAQNFRTNACRLASGNSLGLLAKCSAAVSWLVAAAPPRVRAPRIVVEPCAGAAEVLEPIERGRLLPSNDARGRGWWPGRRSGGESRCGRPLQPGVPRVRRRYRCAATGPRPAKQFLRTACCAAGHGEARPPL